MESVVWSFAGMEHGKADGVEVRGSRLVTADGRTAWRLRINKHPSPTVSEFFVEAGRFFTISDAYSAPGEPGFITTSPDEAKVEANIRAAVLSVLATWPDKQTKPALRLPE